MQEIAQNVVVIPLFAQEVRDATGGTDQFTCTQLA
jgi:hypothetical protein